MVTYNRLNTLKVALAHIFDQTIQPDTLIIVDNNSTDGTQDYLRTIRDTENVHFLLLTSNIGAGAAYTYAMDYALHCNIQPDYFWMVEDDTYYHKNTLAELLFNIESTAYDVMSLKGFKIGFGGSKSIITHDTVKPVTSILLDGSLIKAEIIRKIGPPKKGLFHDV